MELNHLRAFFEVAKIGRFSEASRRLNISQSALSRAVALLELSEGVKLFIRSKNGVSLTPMGTEVFLKCEQLFQTFHDIESLVRGTKETCEGTLRFATTDHVITHLLLEHVKNFRRLYPKVTPSVFTGTPEAIADTLLNTDCEFGLLFSKVTIPQIDYEILRSEKMALVCHPDLWTKHRSTSTTKTLKKILNDVGYIASIGATLQSRPSRVLSELFGDMPPIGVESNSQEAQKRFCLAGEGVAYLARFMVAQEITDGRLHAIPMEHLHEFHFWLATRKGRPLSLTARTFLAHLKLSLA